MGNQQNILCLEEYTNEYRQESETPHSLGQVMENTFLKKLLLFLQDKT